MDESNGSFGIAKLIFLLVGILALAVSGVFAIFGLPHVLIWVAVGLVTLGFGVIMGLSQWLADTLNSLILRRQINPAIVFLAKFVSLCVSVFVGLRTWPDTILNIGLDICSFTIILTLILTPRTDVAQEKP